MLYDAAGRVIKEGEREAMSRRLTAWEPTDRTEADASRALNPTKLDAIFLAANSGDPTSQARLSLEMEEKDGDIAAHLGTRRSAVLGKKWHIEPALEEDAAAKRIAAEAEAMLRAVAPGNSTDVDFRGCLDHILSAILPGYAWLEIIWGAGGKTIEGFAPGLTSCVTFQSSKEPLLVTTDQPGGLALLPDKFVWHRHQARSGDATRGGLIRPLGWLYLFANLGIKDLMRFTEKFGMPFVSARLDEQAWDQDRTKIAYLIRNFGSDGGAVFSKAVELELLEGSSSNGEIYFKLLDYFGSVKTKVILGQTATSGDAGGFSKGQAQSEVRQDILESDAEAVSATVKRCILSPWVRFNFGPEALIPNLKLDTDPPADLSAKADILTKVSAAGFQVNADWVEKEFGMPIDGVKAPAAAGLGLGLAGEADAKKKALAAALSRQRMRR